MSYTQQDVTDLRNALLLSKEGRLRTDEAMMATYDLDVDTLRTAEALEKLKAAHDLLDEVVSLLEQEYDRIGARVADEEGATL